MCKYNAPLITAGDHRFNRLCVNPFFLLVNIINYTNLTCFAVFIYEKYKLVLERSIEKFSVSWRKIVFISNFKFVSV